MATIEDRTIWALRRVMGPQRDLTPTASLADDLDMDSLDRVELVMELEQEFKIGISDVQGEKLKTWGDVRKLVDKLMAAKARIAEAKLAKAAAAAATTGAD
jgi:acyl carrier protein